MYYFDQHNVWRMSRNESMLQRAQHVGCLMFSDLSNGPVFSKQKVEQQVPLAHRFGLLNSVVSATWSTGFAIWLTFSLYKIYDLGEYCVGCCISFELRRNIKAKFKLLEIAVRCVKINDEIYIIIFKQRKHSRYINLLYVKEESPQSDYFGAVLTFMKRANIDEKHYRSWRDTSAACGHVSLLNGTLITGDTQIYTAVTYKSFKQRLFFLKTTSVYLSFLKHAKR